MATTQPIAHSLAFASWAPEGRPEDDTYYRLSLEWRQRIAKIKEDIGHLEGFLANIRAEHGADVFGKIREANAGLSGVRRERELITELVEGLKRVVQISQ